MRKMDCEEARLEAGWAVRRLLSCSVQGKAVSTDKGGDGDGKKGIDIGCVLEEKLIGLKEAEEEKRRIKDNCYDVSFSNQVYYSAAHCSAEAWERIKSSVWPRSVEIATRCPRGRGWAVRGLCKCKLWGRG